LSYNDANTPPSGFEPPTFTLAEVTVLFTTDLYGAAVKAAAA
jgi:hypothetical protein